MLNIRTLSLLFALLIIGPWNGRAARLLGEFIFDSRPIDAGFNLRLIPVDRPEQDPHSAVVDRDGRFVFENIDAGAYRLMANPISTDQERYEDSDFAPFLSTTLHLSVHSSDEVVSVSLPVSFDPGFPGGKTYMFKSGAAYVFGDILLDGKAPENGVICFSRLVDLATLPQCTELNAFGKYWAELEPGEYSASLLYHPTQSKQAIEVGLVPFARSISADRVVEDAFESDTSNRSMIFGKIRSDVDTQCVVGIATVDGEFVRETHATRRYQFVGIPPGRYLVRTDCGHGSIVEYSPVSIRPRSSVGFDIPTAKVVREP